MTTMLESGQVIAARYALVRRIGTGRTGEVWLARDRDAERDVALKILAAEATALSASRAAFLRGAALQREIAHERLLRCLDIRDEGSQPVIVFDYASGGDASRLRGHPWRELRMVLFDVVDALRALHARDLVHRDLKPANVVLDDHGRARLTDLEIALPVGEVDPDRAASPQSSSPQQRRGEPASVADDIYGFGALACELLTGYAPGATPTAGLDFDLVASAGAPDAAAELIRECLDEDPSRRPPDAEALRRRLEDIEAGAAAPHTVPKVVLRAPGAAVEPLQPAWRRSGPATASSEHQRAQRVRRGIAIGGFALLAAATVGVFIALPTWVQQSEPALPAAPSQPDAAATAKAAAEAQQKQKNLEALAEAKRQAEELQPKVAGRFASLERRGAGRWGGPTFASGKTALAEFERLNGDRDYIAALARLESADADLTAVEKAIPTHLASAIAAGGAALTQGNLTEARSQYELVLLIDPANAAARRGLARVVSWNEVHELLARATQLENEGRAPAALEAYRKALTLDPDTVEARDAIARIGARETANAFGAAMARGLDALARKDYASARNAFEDAGRIRPGAPEVRDALAQIQRAQGDEVLAQSLGRAEAAERSEHWQDALAEYRKALVADPNLLAAQQGIERSEPRAQLEAELGAYLARPERLFSSEVRAAARAAVRNAANSSMSSNALKAQAERLQQMIAASETPVHISLASDNRTSVTIYRVGDLGAFERRDMELMPGRYTVVGTRQGFRDVRREVTVLPGRETGTIDIRCEEPI